MIHNIDTIKIAFLGIGLMGKPMVMRLLAANYHLCVWNRNPDKAAPLQAAGAVLAASVAQAVQNADVVISMLSDGEAVQQVMAQGLQAEPTEPALLRTKRMCWIDMSSTQQAQAQTFARQCAERGIGFIDAPVSGGVAGAQAGSLVIMAGGSPADFEFVEAILKVLGRPTLVGAAGCGQLAKLCNQLIVGASIQMLAEALLLAQAGGADPAAVRQAIRGGFAESRVLEVHGQRMLARNFMPGGQVKSQAKDMENILLAAQEAGLKLPVTQLVTEQFRHLLGWAAQADHSAALLGLERLNPGLRLGAGEDMRPQEGSIQTPVNMPPANAI
jgi:2-hydroxy-3-oxopropionate reductase